jgi:hypothetical protein
MSAAQAPQRHQLHWTTDPHPLPGCIQSTRAIIPNHRFLIQHRDDTVHLLVSRTDGTGDALFTMHQSEHDTTDAARQAAEEFLGVLAERKGLGFGGHW